MKLLGEKIRENLCDLGLGKDFLSKTQKVQHIEEKKLINGTNLTCQNLKLLLLQITLKRMRKPGKNICKLYT